MVAKQDICWSFLWCLEEVNLLVFSALLIPGRLLFSWVSYSFHSLLCSAFSTKGNCVSVSPLSTVFIIHGIVISSAANFLNWRESKLFRQPARSSCFGSWNSFFRSQDNFLFSWGANQNIALLVKSKSAIHCPLPELQSHWINGHYSISLCDYFIWCVHDGPYCVSHFQQCLINGQYQDLWHLIFL